MRLLCYNGETELSSESLSKLLTTEFSSVTLRVTKFLNKESKNHDSNSTNSTRVI